MSDAELERLRQLVEDSEELKRELELWQQFKAKIESGQVRHILIPLKENYTIRVIGVERDAPVDAGPSIPVEMTSALVVTVRQWIAKCLGDVEGKWKDLSYDTASSTHHEITGTAP